jgi:peptide/nickel transport system permease protein
VKTLFATLLRSPKFTVAFTVFFIMVATSLLYPIFDHTDPKNMVSMAFQPPSKKFPLGSDNFGRNVLLELIHAIKSSLYVGFMAGVMATLIGVSLGLAAGYIGGYTDDSLTAVNNLFIVIPQLIWLILISNSLKTRSLTIVGIVIGMTSWTWTGRSVRAQATSLRHRDHVNIARISGHNTFTIIVFEILPYIMSYVVMAFILQLSIGIIAEVTLAMLGLGPQDIVTLGNLMYWALNFEALAAGAWWAFIPTCFAIALLVFSLYIMNNGMDEIFNPKIRS